MRAQLLGIGIASACLANPILAGPASVAPTTIHPGDPAVDGTIIKPYEVKWRVMGKAADGSVIQMGTWSDSTKVTVMDGREVLIRRQLWLHDKGAEGYVNVVDRKTLEPILSQHVNSGGTFRRYEFSADGKVVSYDQFPPPPPSDGSQPKPAIGMKMMNGTVSLSEPYYDFNAGMFGLLIAGFPLKGGYAARFPVFRSYDPKSEPAWIDYKVEGKESLTVSGVKKDAWLVVVNSPDTGEVITLDLVKDPPYVLRLRQPWNGRDWTFEMIDQQAPAAESKKN